MKLPVTLMLICMLLSEAFQASAALRCHACASSLCTISQCSPGENRCFTVPVSILGIELGKGCATKAMCDVAANTGEFICCQTDLCNSATGVKMSLLIMLLPLISILFL